MGRLNEETKEVADSICNCSLISSRILSKKIGDNKTVQLMKNTRDKGFSGLANDRKRTVEKKVSINNKYILWNCSSCEGSNRDIWPARAKDAQTAVVVTELMAPLRYDVCLINSK